MKEVIINGRVLSMPLNGIPRYAWEIVHHLDLIDNLPFSITLALPEGTKLVKSLKNISIQFLPQGVMWDYVKCESYARRKKAIYINFASKGTLYRNSIITIHDIRVLRFRNRKTTFKTALTKLKFKFSYLLALHFAKLIVTDSQFSKNEIQKYSHINNIEVVGIGWEHMNEILSDNTVFDDYPQIRQAEYYLSVSSIAPHKNFEWLVENAKINPNNLYVIVGKIDPHLWSDETGKFPSNVLYIGFQEDAKVKALMEYAKALIFPSHYEGFGIPPLEALACGTMAVVSDIPVMHEIYEDSVSYIDPLNADCQLTTVKNNNFFEKTEQILQRNTWAIAAEQWVKIIQKIGE